MKFFTADKYQQKVMTLYEELHLKLRKILPHATIEHIGSSAISGVISKGDLDIYIETNRNLFWKTVHLLNNISFKEKTDTLQNNELRMLICDDYPQVALQVVVKGSPYENFKYFRDALRKDKVLVEKYNEMKLSCQGKSEDCYRKEKSKFIESVLGAKKCTYSC